MFTLKFCIFLGIFIDNKLKRSKEEIHPWSVSWYNVEQGECLSLGGKGLGFFLGGGKGWQS